MSLLNELVDKAKDDYTKNEQVDWKMIRQLFKDFLQMALNLEDHLPDGQFKNLLGIIIFFINLILSLLPMDFSS